MIIYIIHSTLGNSKFKEEKKFDLLKISSYQKLLKSMFLFLNSFYIKEIKKMFSCIPTYMLLFLKNWYQFNWFCLFNTLVSILFSKIPSICPTYFPLTEVLLYIC
jgi:hypothetical protein